ncbi:MAG: hypothetical protein ACK4JB_20980 [Reyranella sp.]
MVQAPGTHVRHVTRLDPGAMGKLGEIFAVVTEGRGLHRPRTSIGRGRCGDLARGSTADLVDFVELACNAGVPGPQLRRSPMNGIIYLVGLVVVVMFILSFLGLR